ncbi:MAG: polyhydroxyalkanoate synthesis regulator [Candidatus Omnitrophota bacterium]
MDIIKEIMGLGLGILVLTKEKTEKIINTLVKEGKLKQDEGSKLIKELSLKGKAEAKDLENKLSKAVNGSFSKLNIATKRDIQRLENEIRKLKARKR